MTVVMEKVAARLLAPAVVVAVAMIVRGYTNIGDGFAAGVVVALAVALQYISLGVERVEQRLPLLRLAPATMVAGMLITLAVGFLPVAFGDPPLTHYPPPGHEAVKIGTLELITAVAFDTGLFLLVAGALVMLVHDLARLVQGDRR